MINSSVVKTFFDEDVHYSDSNFCIRIRKDFISQICQNRFFNHIIDIGCGTGELSIPLLSNCKSLTLIDISEKMLDRAKHNISNNYTDKVILLSGDFSAMKFNSNHYDLVILTGVLAHVPDYRSAISKACNLTQEKGILILQSSNSEHPLSLVIRFLGFFKRLFSKRKYKLNSISNREIIALCKQNGFTLKKKYHSITSFIVFSRLLKDITKFRLIKIIFGNINNNTFPLFGNDIIYAFERNI